jgi:hypothetical protein
MANQFDVEVVNPWQALLLGQQSYASGIEANKKRAMEAARAEAGQLAGAGDTRGALAKLLMAGDLQGANTYSGLDQQQYQRGRDTVQDARADRRESTEDKRWNASHGLAVRSANRLEEGPEEKAAQRAKAAASHGIQPGSPEFKTYVLTGALPEGNTTVAAQTEQRKQAAASLGMTPEHPAYQGFILTGKMPREDAQPLSATDKKAILEADEGVMTARSAIDALKKATDLSAKAFAGPAASGRGYAASFLGESSDIGKGGIATAELNNVVTSNALSQLKAIFGGAPTEGERKILLDIQGSVNQPHEVRVKIYERARQMAENRLRFNEQRAAELRGGQFYKSQGSKQPAAPAVDTAPAGVVDWRTYFGGK